MRCYVLLFLFSVSTSFPVFVQAELNEVNILYLTKSYPEPIPLSLLEDVLEDEGVRGAEFSIRDNNRSGKLLGVNFKLEVLSLDDSGADELSSYNLSENINFIVSDLEKEDLLEVVEALPDKSSFLFNIRTDDDELRTHECDAQLFNMVPSLSMRTDALAQYLIWKRWSKWLVISGKTTKDKAYVTALKRSAKRFGAKIVQTREYQFEAGNKRVETGHQQVQTQMPMVTQGAKEHDVLVVADWNETFGLYLPYRTSQPRPVVGTFGMVATAWHRTYEQFGSARIQRDFEEFAEREMTERDYLAWLSIKAIGKVVMRSKEKTYDEYANYLKSEEFNLAGYKGRPMTFRKWNQQLRQPVLLSADRALISMSPQEGFLHPAHYTDTLGIDKKESECRL